MEPVPAECAYLESKNSNCASMGRPPAKLCHGGTIDRFGAGIRRLVAQGGPWGSKQMMIVAVLAPLLLLATTVYAAVVSFSKK